MEVFTTKQDFMLVDGVSKAIKGDRLFVVDRVSKFVIRLSGPYAAEIEL